MSTNVCVIKLCCNFMEYWNIEIFNYPYTFEPLYLMFSYFCAIINYFVFLSCIYTLFTIKQHIPTNALRKHIPVSSMLFVCFTKMSAG